MTHNQFSEARVVGPRNSSQRENYDQALLGEVHSGLRMHQDLNFDARNNSLEDKTISSIFSYQIRLLCIILLILSYIISCDSLRLVNVASKHGFKGNIGHWSVAPCNQNSNLIKTHTISSSIRYKSSLYMATTQEAVIIGGGPVGITHEHPSLLLLLLNQTLVLSSNACPGLTTAIMLARRGYQVRLYDRLSEPVSPDSSEWTKSLGERNYNIGLNGRGQKALRQLGRID